MIVQRPDTPRSAIVDLDELRTYTRVDPGDGSMDRELDRMAHAAVREAEDIAQIALLAQPIRVTFDTWPRALTVPLPVGPLLDWSTVEVTADGEPFESFSVLTGLHPAIRLTEARPCGGVVIDYVAGWPDVETIPEDLRLAVLDQAAAFFDARGPGDPRVQARSPHFARIIGRYRRVRA